MEDLNILWALACMKADKIYCTKKADKIYCIKIAQEYYQLRCLVKLYNEVCDYKIKFHLQIAISLSFPCASLI